MGDNIYIVITRGVLNLRKGNVKYEWGGGGEGEPQPSPLVYTPNEM